MRVARAEGAIADAPSSNAPGCAASQARPRASSSSSDRTQPSGDEGPSKTTRCRSAGSSARRPRSLRTCSSFSTNARNEPESERMNAHSSAVEDG